MSSIAAVFSEHSGLNRLEYIGRLVNNSCQTLVLQQEYQINAVPNMHEYFKSLKTLRKGCAQCSTAQRTTKPASQINSAIPHRCYQLLGTYIKTAEFTVSYKMQSISPHCTCRISTTFEQTLCRECVPTNVIFYLKAFYLRIFIYVKTDIV